ncbi:multidrug resistance protein fnx1 [Rhizodiscina lignyota]|uniref:Multidrug resistance protein fnx1 n=1 Tax=Rhizodiscina lignyota TaxID=1504668 RepID=A0A9P4M9S9_9PEZI|nr:multidrug resistance protein fnx1 [Rhizodiscina lignyota]
MPASEPSETAPLLHPTSNHHNFPHIDPSASLVPEGAEDATISYGSTDASGTTTQVDTPISTSSTAGLPEVRKRMKYIYPALSVGVFLAAADQTIIVSSYGKIGTDLNALSNTSWIATAYFLTLTSFQPLYGKLSDIFSRKSCLLFAYAIFGLGCLFCGLSPNIESLIAARAFAGIGGGGMTTVVSIILSDTVSLRERGTWQGYINIIYAAGAGAGAPLGGLLADAIGWRWAFLGQAPLCAVAIVAVGLILHMPEQDHTHWRSKLKRIDFLGAFVLVLAVFSLLLALDRGSNVAWKDKYTLAALCSSLPLFLIFVYVEMRVATEPCAPGHIIFERSLVACYLCNFFSFSGWLAAIFYIPLYWQAVNGITATQAGLQMLPSIICGVSGSLFGGFYMQRTGRYYWITVIAYSNLVIGVGLVLLFAGLVAHSTVGMIIGMCICGFSNGIGVTTSLIGIIANCSQADQAVATACSYLFRSMGSVFGVSLSATVANQALRHYLDLELGTGKDAAEIAERVRQSLAYLRQLSPEVRAIVADCYANSTRWAFALQIVIVSGAALSAWFIREKSLNR